MRIKFSLAGTVFVAVYVVFWIAILLLFVGGHAKPPLMFPASLVPVGVLELFGLSGNQVELFQTIVSFLFNVTALYMFGLGITEITDRLTKRFSNY